jgi:hypothetical protein
MDPGPEAMMEKMEKIGKYSIIMENMYLLSLNLHPNFIKFAIDPSIS